MVQSTYLDERDLKALSVHYAGNKQVDLKQSENYKDTPNLTRFSTTWKSISLGSVNTSRMSAYANSVSWYLLTIR